jgi:hypothetical protein
MSEVAKHVEEDWRLARAYELAKQQAEAIAAAARNSSADAAAPATQPATPPTTGPTSAPADDSTAAPALAAAAKAAGINSVVTGWFNQRQPETIQNLQLEQASSGLFRSRAAELLRQAATQPSTPAVSVIELPVQETVYPAQLVGVQPAWDANTLANSELQVEQMIERDFGQAIRARWLTFDAVARRTGWKDEMRTGRTPADTANDSGPANDIPVETPIGAG